MGNLGRLREISAVVARHGLGHTLELRRGRRRIEPGRGDASRMALMAARLCAVLEELGPTFIKFGQVLSSRPDLLPRAVVDALASLQDDCRPMSLAEVEAEVVAALGRPMGELFCDFSPTPMASASIAQVHRAVMPGGQEVAVKVQRPHIRARMHEDVDLLRLVARIVEAIVEEGGTMAPAGVVEHFEEALFLELDFRHEAAMMGRFAANLADGARPYTVPEVFPTHSAATVLTMSLVVGDKLYALAPGRDRVAIAHNVVVAAFHQLFVDGLFHADPHPGNWFVLADDRLALIDFGATGSLSFAMREALVALVLSISTRDADATARLLYRQGAVEERVDLHRLRDACANLFDQSLGDARSFAELAPSQLLRELFDLAHRFRLRLPPEYAQVTRASMTIEGIIRELDPALEVLGRVRPLIRRLVEERFSLPTLGDTTLKNLLRARDLARDLPLTASQILMDLDGGRMRLTIESAKLDQLVRGVNSLGVVVFTGLVTAALIVGSMVILARYEWAIWGLPVVPLVALYLASLLIGGALGRHFLAPRLRKISLTRWAQRRRRAGLGRREP